MSSCYEKLSGYLDKWNGISMLASIGYTRGRGCMHNFYFYFYMLLLFKSLPIVDEDDMMTLGLNTMSGI